MKTVQGVFHDRKRVTRAVERLVAKSVPVDEITVTTRNASGSREVDIPVEDEMGALHGALVGAGAGAGLGFVAAVFAIAVYGGWSEMATLTALSWVVSGALIGVVGGVPLGALLWMGRWRKRKELESVDLAAGSVVVEVRSDELADVARDILEEAGAEEVTTR